MRWSWRLVAVVVCVGMLGALTGAPSSAAPNRVRLEAPARAEVGERVVLRAHVTPPVRGRAVTFQRRAGGGWTTLGERTTNARGAARLVARFERPGRVVVRAVAARHRGAARVVARRVVDVRGSDAEHLDVVAPAWVEGGQPFEVTLLVGSESAALDDAVLSVRASGGGRQGDPAGSLSVDPATGTGAMSVGDHPAGEPRAVTVRWVAPAPPATLEFTGRLVAAGGVEEEVGARVQVVRSPVGGGLFGDDLASFSESAEAPTDPDLLLPGCLVNSPVHREVPSYATALSQANSWLRQQLRENRRSDWEALPGHQDADLLDEVIATAVLADRPAAALAAALRANELRPQHATHLSNASAAASLLDRPDWGVAFAMQAGQLPPAPSVGVRQEAVRLVNLGHAWAVLGDLVKAESALRRAVAADPASQQARAELAAVLVCAGQRQAGLEHARRALRTDDAPDPITLGEPGAGGTTIRDSGDLFDPGDGVPQTLVLPKLPDTWAEFVGLSSTGEGSQYYRRQLDRVLDRLDWLRSRHFELEMRLFPEGVRTATERRTSDLLGRIGTHADRVVVREYDQYVKVLTRADPTTGVCADGQFADHPFCSNFPDEEANTCDRTRAVFDRYRSRMSDLLNEAGQMHSVVAPRLSSLQAQLSDPLAHELAGVLIEQVFAVELLGIVENLEAASQQFATFNELYYLRDFEEDPPCVAPALPAGPEPAVSAEVEAAPPCRPGSDDKRLGITLEFSFLTLSGSCEKLSVEGSVPLTGWADAFISYTSAHGTGPTLNIGIKYGADDATFESSLYVRKKADGSLHDVGWKVGPSLSAGKVVQVEVFEDAVEISLMAVFTDVD